MPRLSCCVDLTSISALAQPACKAMVPSVMYTFSVLKNVGQQQMTCNQRKSACTPAQSDHKLHLVGQCMLSESQALLSLRQMVSVLSSCRSVTPNYVARCKFPKVPSMPRQNGRQLRLCTHASKPESAFDDEQNDQMCHTKTSCQSPSDIIQLNFPQIHTSTVQHMSIYSYDTSFLIFLLEDGAQSGSLAAPAKH